MLNFIRYLIIIFSINFHVYGNDELYSITDNKVFLQNDANILELRDRAKNIAFENAFKILTKKIIEQKDLNKLNLLDNIKIGNLVNEYKISDEEISEISYSSNISVSFNPRLTLEFFKKNKIRVQTIVSDEYLVFPILNQFSTLYLWEVNNIWYDNLKEDYDEVGLLKLYFPEKNHLNKLKISARAIIKKDIEDIKKFLEIHKKKKAIIIFLKETFDNENGFFTSKVNITAFSNDEFEEIPIFEENKLKEKSSTTQIKLMSKVVINELQVWWKSKIDRLESESDIIKEIFIKHNFKDLKKSVFVEKVLLDIFDNDEITLDEIKGDSLIFKLLSNYSIDKINLALSRYGLVIKQDSRNFFSINEVP